MPVVHALKVLPLLVGTLFFSAGYIKAIVNELEEKWSGKGCCRRILSGIHRPANSVYTLQNKYRHKWEYNRDSLSLQLISELLKRVFRRIRWKNMKIKKKD